MSQQPTINLRREQRDRYILIVDDEVIIRDLCKRVLKGYSVLEAGNGEEALQLFRKGGIDVVLTDVMMPGMDGIELLNRLKEKDPTLVVVIMTGFAEKDIILNALKADADDFITKPLNLLQLKIAVDRAIDKKMFKEEIVRLKSLDRLKSGFLSIVSHKFRTPITAISLFLQNLATGNYNLTDPDFYETLRQINDEAGYLELLVTDLLIFSSVMGKEGLKLEPCKLNKIILQILSESKEVAAKLGVKTSLDLVPIDSLLLDRGKISFAIKQVVDNAYKFSGKKGKVTIALKPDADTLKIIVSDTGIGIAREEIPKIFEKFYQVDPSMTGQIRGFGLGLYYAGEFIRLHGGVISIESEQGKGTCVTITLPAQIDNICLTGVSGDKLL